MKHPGAILHVALAMSGCAGSEPVAIAPPIAAPAVYATDLPAAGLQEEWWLGFGDPVLDRLVRRGLEANLDIDAASGRLAAAAALLRAERADRLPGLDGSAEIGTTLVGEGEDTAVAGLFALFDSDLNGRLAAEVRAAVADYAETNYLLAEQRRLVAAAIASQYIEYRRTQTQLDLLEQSTDLQDQTLRIVTLRFEAGLAANLDVRRAAADLAQTRARRGLVEIARANALSALAILLAEPPGPSRSSRSPMALKYPDMARDRQRACPPTCFAGGPISSLPKRGSRGRPPRSESNRRICARR
ncbi:TolC family protein [Qipengyuania sp. GPGPB31]|uniref:TolC family protein n=1 Tax=Qipengyuania sp. GPGPB31 TaxID=3023518 RepID=UPI0031344234